MEQFDKYFKRTKISDEIEILTLLDEFPDDEHLLRTKVESTGKTKFINKKFLLKNYKEFKPGKGIQTKMFKDDKTDHYKKLFSHGNKNNHQ